MEGEFRVLIPNLRQQLLAYLDGALYGVRSLPEQERELCGHLTLQSSGGRERAFMGGLEHGSR